MSDERIPAMKLEATWTTHGRVYTATAIVELEKWRSEDPAVKQVIWADIKRQLFEFVRKGRVADQP